MSDLAIDGGPRAVTALMNDSWQDVSDLEKEYVNQVLDNKDDAYAELDKFEEEYRAFVGTKHALCMCNGTATLHSAIFAAGACAGKEVIVPTATRCGRRIALRRFAIWDWASNTAQILWVLRWLAPSWSACRG